jgi:type IV pilus biogenesis protein PilP
MQKTKLTLALSAIGFCLAMSSAYAADPIQPAQVEQAEVTQVRSHPDSTIGRMAEKRRQLDELKLDKEITKLRQEIAPPPPTFIPQMIMPEPRQARDEQVEANHIVTAIFGQANKLRAEVQVNGMPYVVSKGSNNIPGWRVEDVQNNKVVLSNGKRSKSVYISAAAAAEKESATPLPGLPPMGLPSVGGM